MTSRRRADAGFTLIEMLVVVTILAVVGPLFAFGALQSVKVTAQSSATLADSGNRDTFTSQLVNDVESATSITANPATTPCALPTPSTAQLLVTAPDPSDPTSSIDIVYFVGAPAGTTTQLLRLTCTASTTSSARVMAQWPASSASSSFSCPDSSCGQVAVFVSPVASGTTGSDVPFTLTVNRRTQ